MLDSSSQLLLDNVAPQPKSENLSATKAGSSKESSFSSYFNDANQKAQTSSPEKQNNQNDSSNKETAVVSSQTKKTEHKPVSKENKTESEDSKESVASVQGKKTETNRKLENSDKDQATDKDSSEAEVDAATKANVVVKTGNFNPLMLVQNPTTEKTEADAEGELSEGEEKAQPLSNLIARILQNRNNLKQAEETVVKEAAKNEPLDQLNVAPEKTAEFVKAVVSELRSDDKLRSDLQKQVSIKQQDALTKGEASDMKEALSLEENASLLEDQKVDDFIAKIFDRLNMNKSNLETLISAKASNEKMQINNELIDQISQKASAELTERMNMMPSVGGINQKNNNLLPAQQFTMNTHINKPEWGNEFGSRIQFMIKNNIQTAELRLDPPELGKINVKINLSSDQANVTFTSAHQNVRETIESTLPRLRELLAESGLQLGNADVSSHSHQQAKEQRFAEGGMSGPILPSLDDELGLSDSMHTPKIQYSIDGVIDYFA